MTEARARMLLTLSLVTTALGVAVAGTMSRTAGGILVVAGWLGLIASLHAYGRAGSTPRSS